MDLKQLRSALQGVASALEGSGLDAALCSYETKLARDDDMPASAESLMQAANAYMDRSAAYNSIELVVAESLQLRSLQSPGFWFDITLKTLDAKVRVSKLEDTKAKVQFAGSQLSQFFYLLDNSCASLSSGGIKQAAIGVRIHDAVENASDPDRISRLIDGVDMIYRACAELADEPVDGLQLMSVSGSSSRTVVFNGHIEVCTATRRIIRTLHQQATGNLQSEDYSVEQIAEALPFMHAVDELFRIGALDAELANDITEGVLGGAIMLLECGASIHEETVAPVDATVNSGDAR